MGTACATAKSSRQWFCVCGTPWIACQLHSASGFLCASPARAGSKRKHSCLAPTDNYTSNSQFDIATLGSASQGVHRRKRVPRPPSIPNDLGGASSGSFVLPGPTPHAKRIRFIGGTASSHQHKRAPHLLQADAVATVKRMRQADPLPLSAFLPTGVYDLSSPVTTAVRPKGAHLDVDQG
jgi:hypothetical protein